MNRNTVGLLVFIASTGLLIVSGEPVQYRQNQRIYFVQSARQTSDPAETYGAPPYPAAGQRPDKSLQLPSEIETGEQPVELPSEIEIQTEEAETETPTTTEQEQTPAEAEGRSGTNGPYPPSGWKPEGVLLVLPLDAQASETTTAIAEDVTTTTLPSEIAEPQGRSQSDAAPYAPSGWKPSGQLLLLPNEQETLAESSPAAANRDQENNENDDKEPTTVDAKATATTDKPLARLETTSEPDAEPVDVNVQGQNNPAPNTPPVIQAAVPGAYFVQLPNGSLQRIIYLAAPLAAPAAVAAPIATSNVQYQQLIQAQPNIAPRVVAYTTQYQSW